MKYELMNLLADAAATAADPAAAEMAEMSTGATIIYTLVQLLPMILIFVVFYFMLIRPQRKKDKEAKAMLSSVGFKYTSVFNERKKDFILLEE